MTDFERFERSLAAALRRDADEFISPFDPGAVARAAISSRRRGAARAPWNGRTMNDARFAVAATIAVLAVGAAVYVFGPTRDMIGPSSPLEPSPSAAISATSAPTARLRTAQPGMGSWTETTDMTNARSGFMATPLRDGRVLITGGPAGSGYSAELYDPTDDSWTTAASMAFARQGHSATLLADGRVLIAGGDGVAKSAELFDPALETWRVTGSMTQARSELTAVLLPDGRVLVLGGGDDPKAAELYDPVDGTWTATASMTEARSGFTATVLPNGRVLVAGGFDDDRLSSVELYDPVAQTWTTEPNMTEPFLAHTATLLSNGTVLVAGGDAPTGSGARGHAHAALYDPATRTWTAAQDMSRARFAHTATLLPSGEVLVAGGRVHSGLKSEAFFDAELYDPATGTWTAAAGMHLARSQHSAVLLADGRVLVVGGYGARGDATAAAELFDLQEGS